MKLGYEKLEIWQLAMKLVGLTYSYNRWQKTLACNAGDECQKRLHTSPAGERDKQQVSASSCKLKGKKTPAFQAGEVYKDRFPPEDRYGLWNQLVRAVESILQNIAEGYVKSTGRERALYMSHAKGSTAEARTSFRLAVKKGRLTEGEYQAKVEPLIQELFFKLVGYQKWLLNSSPKRGVAERFTNSTKRSDPPSEAIHQAKRSTNSPNSHGFTLVELLVVIALLGIVAGIAGDLFYTVIRAYNKAQILNEVEQNGSYALSLMEQQIRNAESVFIPGGGTSGTSLTLTTLEGGNITYLYAPGSGSGATCLNGRVERGAQPITNTDNVKGINVTDLSFSIGSGTPPTVTIVLNLEQACNSPTRRDFRASTTLRTTVVVRGGYE